MNSIWILDKYSKHLNTGLVRYWSSRFESDCQMVVWKLDWISLFMVQKVHSNGRPSHIKVYVASVTILVTKYWINMLKWISTSCCCFIGQLGKGSWTFKPSPSYPRIRAPSNEHKVYKVSIDRQSPVKSPDIKTL